MPATNIYKRTVTLNAAELSQVSMALAVRMEYIDVLAAAPAVRVGEGGGAEYWAAARRACNQAHDKISAALVSL